MNNYQASSKYKQLMFITCAAVIVTLVWHIMVVNFSLSFMTMDELHFILFNFAYTYNDVAAHGRVSHLISWPITNSLSFNDPTNIELIPRLISILSLYLILSVYLQTTYNSWIYSITFASIAMGGHLIDWQHNGMVAYFGSYNILLSAFLLSLIFSKNNTTQNFFKQAAICLLLLVSFASEFFFGLAGLCAAYFILTEKNNTKKAAPFIAAILIYILLYIIFRLFIDPITPTDLTKEGMNNYLYGNIDNTFSLVDLIKGTFLYTYNSIPISSVNISPSHIYLYITSILALTLLLMYGRDKVKSIKNSLWELLLISSTLFIVPNFLISLQPMKLEWALTGASTRYVFSYYAWIGFVLLLSAALFLITKKRIFPIILFSIIAGPFIVNSMKHSLEFIEPYKESTSKWRDLNKQLSHSKTDTIVISSDFLEHPGITPISEDYLSHFSKKFYNKGLSVFSNPADGFNFGPHIPPFITEMHGIAGYEKDGRWTDGKEAIFHVKDNIPDNITLTLTLSGVYGPNIGSKVIVKIGDWSDNFTAFPDKTFEFNVSKSTVTNEIKILIPYPTSPSEVESSDDPRKLGIRLTHLSFMPTK